MHRCGVFAALVLLSAPCYAADVVNPITNDKVVQLALMLELKPLDKDVDIFRALLLDWEDKSKDVVDVVCPGLFKSLFAKSTPYQPILFSQFVIGSAASQIATPSAKGQLMPQQLAGMRSMLHVYSSLRALDSKVSLPELDNYAAHDADGTLEQFMKPLVERECKPHN